MKTRLFSVVGVVVAALVASAGVARAQPSGFLPPTTVALIPPGDPSSAVIGGIAVDKAGNLYAIDQLGKRVLEAPRGTHTVKTLPFSRLHVPGGLAVDDAGDVFVSDTAANNVFELQAGHTSASPLLGANLNAPAALAVNSTGNVVYIAYVDPQSGATDVEKIVYQSYQVTFVADVISSVTPPPGNLGLDVSRSGNLFVTDANNQRVIELPAGSTNPFTLLTGPFDPFGGYGFGPGFPSTDASGNLFFSDGNGGIIEHPAAGGALETIGEPGLIFGLAADVAGSVYAEQGTYPGQAAPVFKYQRVLPVGGMVAGPASGVAGTVISAASKTACPVAYTTDVELFFDNASGKVVKETPARLMDTSGDWAGTITVPAGARPGAYFVTAQCQSAGLDLQNSSFITFTVK